MLIRKTDPVGVDKLIDALQVFIDQLNLPNWNNYARAYKNPKRFDERGFIPEVYTSNGNYEEVFFNDKYSITSFFVVGDSRNTAITGRSIVTVSLIVQCKLKDVFPQISHRADEELINMFWNKLKAFTLGAKVESIETHIDDVYKEFVREQVKFDNLGNFNVVRFNMTGAFDSECCDEC